MTNAAANSRSGVFVWRERRGYFKTDAEVAELVDALDLGSSGAIRGGSSPPFRILLNGNGFASSNLRTVRRSEPSSYRSRCFDFQSFFFRFNHKLLYIANSLVDHRIGLEETDDGIWSIYFNTVLIATLDERDYIIRG